MKRLQLSHHRRVAAVGSAAAILLITATAFFLTTCVEPETSSRNANATQNQNANSSSAAAKNNPPNVAVVEPIPTFAPVTPTPNSTLQPSPPATTVLPPAVSSSSSSPLASPPPGMEIVAVPKLIVPVAGIKPEQLQDTFKDSRSEGRVHDAIDIIAPQGTPVLAVADGEIARFFDSARGGITIYQFSRDKKLIYYYAHLQRRADGLQEGQYVKQGTVIGYVGDTGNSGAGNFHLHFAIWTVDDPKRYWDGTNINPYPLLR